MQAIVIYCTAVLSEMALKEIAEVIIRESKDGGHFDLNHFTESDIRALLTGAKQPSAAVLTPVVKPTVEAELKASIIFMTENFGEPLDSEDAFRARFNKAWYRRGVRTIFGPEQLSTAFDDRLTSCVRIFAKFAEGKIDRGYTKLLSDNGFKFMPAYCRALLRDENM